MENKFMEKAFTALGMGMMVIFLIIAVSLVTGAVTTLAWNYTMPTVFGLPSIGYLDGVALNILAGTFFKSERISVKD